MEDKYLIQVTGNNNNKFYEMKIDESSHTFTAYWGRVGSTRSKTVYPLSKFSSTLRSKLKKGYKDITDLMKAETVINESSGNDAFDMFYDTFKKYVSTHVKSTYVTSGASAQQILEAQALLNKIDNSLSSNDINKILLQIFNVLPRKMRNVNDYLFDGHSSLASIVQREQDALDSLDSASITSNVNPLDEMNIVFREGTSDEYDMIGDLLIPTCTRSVSIHKVYNVYNKDRDVAFKNYLNKVKNKECQYLIHGTRCPNVFSILKSGLLVRPSNAVSFAGSAYGDGVYHSAHTDKSLNYTGYDRDIILFIQNVNMGKPYTYSGWYRSGKDLDRSKMNYNDIHELGYNSLFVRAGDGLMNSEYIVYNSDQTNTEFLVWLKR